MKNSGKIPIKLEIREMIKGATIREMIKRK
jgi:hypothetical protein